MGAELHGRTPTWGEIATGIISADMSGQSEGWLRIQLGSLDQRITFVARPRPLWRQTMVLRMSRDEPSRIGGLEAAGCDSILQTICLKAMAKEKTNRYQSAERIGCRHRAMAARRADRSAARRSAGTGMALVSPQPDGGWAASERHCAADCAYSWLLGNVPAGGIWAL